MNPRCSSLPQLLLYTFLHRLRTVARPSSIALSLLLSLIITAPALHAATLTFSPSAPAATPDSISNWTGATFDADNVGGSGVNADGGLNNGGTNDGTTYVSGNRPAQGQTFTTGPNPGGYTISSITVRAAGYTSNIATGTNVTYYSLASTNSTFRVRVGRLSGTTFIPYTVEYATSGGTGTPGTGNSANGSGTYLTFTLKAPLVLQPNTTYAFDIGTTGDYFEMLGIRDAATGGNPYAAGTAYTSGANGAGNNTVTTQTGDRVFQVNLTAYTAPAPGAFVHPGLLNTDADFERIRTNVALGQEPWLSNYNALNSSWMAQSGGWASHAQATITRSGSTNDTSRLYQDIAVIYTSALRWKISGDTAYADQAVALLNSWGYTLTSVQGDTNVLLTELYGAQYAQAAEMMRTYPGWAPADIAQCQTMVYNVFYPLADNFLASHFGTSYDHYWANWDFAAMNAIYAIGVFCDNTTLTTEAVNYFYNGVGNGCIDRAVNFIHPGNLGQGQEMGRDQGHATLDIAQIAAFCQMAWNQGTDLFGYENNRVLAMAEYTAKYNLGQDVPWTNYGYGTWWPTVWLQTGVSSSSRGLSNRPGWPTLYNHYVNLKGMDAPYSKQMAANMGTGWDYNGDSLGWDQLTSALSPVASGTNPSGLSIALNGQRPCLSWWGTANATGYNVKRSTTHGGSYTTIASGVATNTYTDLNPVAGVTNYYVVTGVLSGGGETGVSNEAAAILGSPVYTQLNFNETSGTTATDSTGNGWNGTLVNGATWTTGKSGNAVNLSKASSQYVSLPAGIVADVSDLTVSAWVYQNSASNGARIFDFGSGDGTNNGTDPWGNQAWTAERYLFLTSQDGGGKVKFGITHSSGTGEEDIVGTSSLPTGQWVHVSVTLSAGIGTLYVNGEAVGQNVNMPMTPMQFPPTTQNFIGRSQWRNDPYFDGKVDDFRIYRGALTPGAAYTLATGLAPATPAPAPANFTATAQVGNQMLLSWTASPGATSYTIRRSTSPGGPYTIIAGLVNGTSYTDTGLTAGVTYYYVVDSYNTGGDGAYSTQSSAVALPPAPSVATNLAAVAASATSVNLTWTAGANATSYNVKRTTVSGSGYTTVATGVSATSFTDTGLTAEATYYYVVTAVNAAGESANSNEDNATPSYLLVQLKLDETSGTTAADSRGNGWDGTTVNNPAWGTGKFGNAISLTRASSQYLTVPSGVVSSLSNYTISAWVKLNSQATWQRIFDFGTGTNNYLFLTTAYSTGNMPRVGIRTPSIAEQDINGTVAIPTNTWVHVAVTLSGSTGKLYVNGVPAGTNTAMTLSPSSLGNTTQNYIGKSQWNDPYLDGGVDDFRIYSRALSDTEVSSLASASLAAPQNVSLASNLNQITVSWDAVPNATSYILRYATVSGGPYTTLAKGLTSLNYTHTGLSYDTTYYYVVSAVYGLGEGPNSAAVNGSPLPPAGTWLGNGADANWLTSANWSSLPTAGNPIYFGGTTQLTNTNNFTAGTQFAGIAFNNGGAFVLGGNAIGLTGDIVNNSGSTETLNLGLTLTGADRTINTVGGNVSIVGVISGGFGLIKDGPATLTLSGANTFTGGMTLQAGTLLAGNASAFGTGALSLNDGGTLGTTAALTIGNAIAVNGFDTIGHAGQAGNSITLSGALTGGGTLSNFVGSNGNSNLIFAGNLSGFTGTLAYTCRSGSDTQWWRVGATNTTADLSNASLVLSLGNVTNLNATGKNFGFKDGITGATLKLGALSGNGVFQASYNNSGPNTLQVGYLNTNTLFSGVLAGGNAGTNMAVTKVGTGMLTLSGTNIYSGATTVQGGILNVTGALSGTGAVTVSGSGALAGNGTIAGAATVASGGVLSPGSGGPGAVGTLTLSSTLTLNGGSVLNMDLIGTSNSDKIALTGALTASGTTTINLTALAGFAGTGTYPLITTSTGSVNAANFAIGTSLAGYTGTLTASGGTLSLVVGPPPAPGGLTATGANSQVSLAWGAVSTASSYNLKRATTSGGSYTVVATGLTQTSYTDTSLAGGTTYYYVVTASNLGGEGASSTEASAITAPAAPGSLVATAGNGQVVLSWAASTGAGSYTIRRSTTSGTGYVTVASGVSATSYTDTGLNNGTTYYYEVTAQNASGSSPTSTETNAITAPAAPTSLTATKGNASVALTWPASSGAASYKVKRSLTSGSGYTVVASGVTATTYNDTGLTNGTTYYYVVSAVNTGGESGNSSEANARPLGALPSPWASADVGAVAAAGNAGYATGTYYVTGSGADIGGTADEFQYVYQTATGDCQIVARVATIQNTNSLAKSGVTIRETTAAGSRHASIVVTPGGTAYFLSRSSTGGTTTSTSKTNLGTPRWLKMVRSGNKFTAYYSSNGTSWTQLGTAQTITMGTTTTIGIPVTSKVDGTLCTATVDNVTATP